VAVIAVTSGKAAPGVSTTVAGLAAVWPHAVVVADCDPAGGDLAPGWLGQWLVDGKLDGARGVLSFATETRHAPTGEASALMPHLQRIPVAPRAWLLAGLAGPAQQTSVGDAGWRRVAQALGDASATGGWDVLIDLGRFGTATPAPLLAVADLLLVALRPTPRHVLAARWMIAELAQHLEPGVLAVAALAASTTGGRDVRRALDLPVAVELPEDSRTGTVFSDGANGGEPPQRSPLLAAARQQAHQLHTRLNLRPPPPVPPPRDPRSGPRVREVGDRA
jgi:hypothetical protein